MCENLLRYIRIQGETPEKLITHAKYILKNIYCISGYLIGKNAFLWKCISDNMEYKYLRNSKMQFLFSHKTMKITKKKNYDVSFF